MCRDVSLARRFSAKFREMRMAFRVAGDQKAMALACYADLGAIHSQLC
jgi:hypothetical protein